MKHALLFIRLTLSQLSKHNCEILLDSPHFASSLVCQRKERACEKKSVVKYLNTRVSQFISARNNAEWRDWFVYPLVVLILLSRVGPLTIAE